MKKVEITFAGILVFDNGTTIRFPDGRSFHHRHTAFVRFKKDDLVNPPSGKDCDSGWTWIEIIPGDTLSLDGIKEKRLDYASGFFSRKVVELGEVCTNDPKIRPGVRHATLRLAGGKLAVDRQTQEEWEFRPNSQGKPNSKGIKRQLVNRVRLRASLEDGQLKLHGIGGQEVLFEPRGDALELAFGNAPDPCPPRIETEASRGAPVEEPDDHFELYYKLIQHKCTEDHLPWGKKIWETEEGGGCPPIFKR
jgi:hypothetical protein